MGSTSAWLLAALLAGQAAGLAWGQDPKEFVRAAVQTELAADAADHSRWIYFEADRKPERFVKQWVADTSNGSLRRVVEIDGRPVSKDDQRKKVESFLADRGAQSKQRKGEQSDDKQAEELLRILPDAFIWINEGEKGSSTVLHFRPNPNFRPPDMEARVFAAMEGDLAIDTQQHRIASLKGRLIRDVKIAGGLLGALDSGGTFDVERRELNHGIWQITETHVHIQGHVLFFKTISEQEDDVKTNFKQLPGNITIQQVKEQLLAEQ